jgi:predicted transcriptional regulator
VESLGSPHIVSGSAMRIFFREAICGPLNGRFRYIYVEPLNDEDGAELARKVASREKVKITDNVALRLTKRTGGNPFYIKCVVLQAKGSNISLDRVKGLDECLYIELTRGEISKFFREQLSKFFSYTEENGLLKMYMYIAKCDPKRGLDVDEIQSVTGYKKQRIYKLLAKLSNADMIEEDIGSYKKFKDPLLYEYMAMVYEKEIEKLSEEEIKKRHRKIGFMATEGW